MNDEATPVPRPIVLLGGYWLGPWAWQEVRDLLVSAALGSKCPPSLGSAMGGRQRT